MATSTVSRRRPIAVLVIVAAVCALLSVLHVWADAEVTLNLPRTGQSGCYDVAGNAVGCAGTGHDGEMRAGAPWPSPRFQNNGDQTITDRLTGLTWTQNGETPGNHWYTCSATNITINWQEALDHVACLNSRNFLGHNDWRLPNINELESLVNSNVANSSDWLESQGFINVWGSQWSSTTFKSTDLPAGTFALAVNFLTGETGITAKTATSYLPAVWPVRGTSQGVTPLWKTGQTSSYAAGDDGASEAGVAWPNGRFVAQGECVTDRMTGLMWTQDADRMGGLRSWQQALDYANGLNLCGFDDWRLANRKELWSLLNREALDPAAWLMAQGFSNVRREATGGPYNPYWTSTTYMYNPVAVFGVRMDGGHIFAFMKSPMFDNGYVWPVRGGATGGVALPTDTPTSTPTPTPTPTPLPKPTITDVLPAEGKAEIAGSLQILGGNFKPGAVARLGSNRVLSTTYGAPDQLLAHVPVLPAGAYDLWVINPDGLSGSRPAAYTARGPAVDDLYAHDYELLSAHPMEVAGEGSFLLFAVHRLGGAADLKNVKVAFYLGDPAAGGQKVGESTIATLRPNSFTHTHVNWTPTQPGTFTVYAVIDPGKQVPEANEGNNVYRSWVEVQQAAPVDTAPPTVDQVHVGLSQYTTGIPVTVDASDPNPSSGLAWAYYLFWEFVPSINDWLVLDESGWLPFSSSQVVSIFDWPGPRFVEVFVADAADNVSDPSGLGVFNYIPPSDFLLEYESRWYLVPMLAGDELRADLSVSWPDPDLYVWGEDGTRYAYSATDGSATERVRLVAPRDGWYWVEVYAYADYPTFFLSLAVVPGSQAAQAAPEPAPETVAAHTLRSKPGINLAAAPLSPSRSYRLPSTPRAVYLPLIAR